MEKYIRKFIFTIGLGVATIFLGIFLSNTLLNFQQTHYTKQILDHKKRKTNASDADTERRLKEAQLKKVETELIGFRGKYTLYKWDEKKGYLGIKGFNETPRTVGNNINAGEGILRFSYETKRHFVRIIDDVDKWLAKGELDGLPGVSESHSYKQLFRNNCILYGAPGTGKTEFVREISHVFIQRYGEVPHLITKEEHETKGGPWHGFTNTEEEIDLNTRAVKYPRVPVFEIKGLDLMSTGIKGEPTTHEKLIASVKQAKRDFFEDEDSELPYVVFLEEADQAKNPMTYSPGAKNNLEELKNFFSTAEESQGLKSNSQDRNSIFIATTNNYDTIDPGMLRWGRLGVSLNFTWSPETIKEYGGSNEVSYQIPWLKNEDNSDHYCWKFDDNEDRALLFKVAERMNFYNYEKDFVPITKNILAQWQSWKEEDRDDFARSRLGFENRVWCPTCLEEKNIETLAQKYKRIENALKYGGNKEEREEIKREEEDKKIASCGHKYKPICNWLLHYLHTFFSYEHRNDLASLNHPRKIERYEFNDARLLREKINQLRIDLNEMGQDWTNIFGNKLHNIAEELKRVNDISVKGMEDIQNISRSLDDFNKDLNEKLSQAIIKMD